MEVGTFVFTATRRCRRSSISPREMFHGRTAIAVKMAQRPRIALASSASAALRIRYRASANTSSRWGSAASRKRRALSCSAFASPAIVSRSAVQNILGAWLRSRSSIAVPHRRSGEDIVDPGDSVRDVVLVGPGDGGPNFHRQGLRAEREIIDRHRARLSRGIRPAGQHDRGEHCV